MDSVEAIESIALPPPPPRASVCVRIRRFRTHPHLLLRHSSPQGTKGLKEYIKAHEAFQHTFLFGCFRVVGMDRAGGIATKRVRYVYTTFVGNGVPEKMRAQFNPLKTQVEKFFGTVQMVLHMTGTSLDLDLSPNQLGFKLHNSSGSHKSELYDFGGGLTVDAKEFTHADAEVSFSSAVWSYG